MFEPESHKNHPLISRFNKMSMETLYQQQKQYYSNGCHIKIYLHQNSLIKRLFLKYFFSAFENAVAVLKCLCAGPKMVPIPQHKVDM